MRIVILYGVYELLGMFQTHPHGDALGLELHPLVVQHVVDIAGRVPGGQNDRAGILPPVGRDDAPHLVALDNKAIHAGLEVDFASRLENAVAHALDNGGQFVGADMRMGIGEYRYRGTMLAKDLQNAVYIAPLLTAGVELAVGEGTCPTLAETVVRLGVDALLAADAGNILATVVHVLSPLDHDGAYPQLNQAQGGKQSGRAGTHHHRLRFTRHIAIVDAGELVVLRKLVDVQAHLQIDHDGALASVYRALQHPHALHRAYIYSLLTSHIGRNVLFAGCLLGQNS